MEKAKSAQKRSVEFVLCNLCGSDSSKPYMEISGYSIVQCVRCDLVYVNPRLKESELHDIYNESYYRNPAFRGKQTTFYGYGEYIKEKDDIRATFQRRLKWINKFSKKGKLLDIGCATGFFLELATEHGWKVQGLELAKFAHEYATKKLKLPVLNKTLEDAKFKEESFEAVSLFDVVEHLPNPKSTVKEVHRVLKKGGVFAITTPNIGSLVAKMLGKNWEEVRRVREHIYFFSEKTLKRMLEESGFEVLRVETAGRYFSVHEAIERGKLYDRLVFGVAEKIVRAFGMDKMKVYVDPRYKMTIYARKR